MRPLEDELPARPELPEEREEGRRVRVPLSPEEREDRPLRALPLSPEERDPSARPRLPDELPELPDERVARPLSPEERVDRSTLRPVVRPSEREESSTRPSVRPRTVLWPDRSFPLRVTPELLQPRVLRSPT